MSSFSLLISLSAELLANKIRQDPKIEGIKILENEIKLRWPNTVLARAFADII